MLILILLLSLIVCKPAPAKQPEALADDVHTAQQSDLNTVITCRRGIISIQKLLSHNTALFAENKPGQSHLPNRKARIELIRAWSSLLDYYTGLEAIAGLHKDFIRMDSKVHQKSSFNIFRSATYAAYRHAMDFISIVEDNPALDTVLNEPSPVHGLPEGTYREFKFNYLNVYKAVTFAAFETLAEYYGPVDDEAVLAAVLSDRKRIWDAGKGKGSVLTVKNGIDILNKTVKSAWFPVQKGVSNWMGETKVYRNDGYLIPYNLITEARTQLLPGDILLERREWYMTNVGIPGYWTHAALYVGNAEERKGFFSDAASIPWVTQKGADSLEELLKSTYPLAYEQSKQTTGDGTKPAVIEAIAKGVMFTSFEHSAHCDALAVLRPKIDKSEKARAVFLAFGYLGRPYDYDFDFATDSRLVCSELIYKVYAPDVGYQGIKLPLEEMFGRMLTPVNAYARFFKEEYGSAQQQMDFVLFIDGYEKNRNAVNRDVTAFMESWKRPKWHIITQSTPPEVSE
jgi:hypothetical protein